MVLERACNLGWVRYSGTLLGSFKELIDFSYFFVFVFFSFLIWPRSRQGPFDVLFFLLSFTFFPAGRAHSVLRGRRLYGWCTVFLTIFGM